MEPQAVLMTLILGGAKFWRTRSRLREGEREFVSIIINGHGGQQAALCGYRSPDLESEITYSDFGNNVGLFDHLAGAKLEPKNLAGHGLCRPINGVRGRLYADPDYTDWGEIVSYTDDKHYHIRLLKADDGLYETIRDGENHWFLKDGKHADSDPHIYNSAVCAALCAAFGEHFSGYEHNYIIRDGIAYAEGGEPGADHY